MEVGRGPVSWGVVGWGVRVAVAGRGEGVGVEGSAGEVMEAGGGTKPMRCRMGRRERPKANRPRMSMLTKSKSITPPEVRRRVQPPRRRAGRAT